MSAPPRVGQVIRYAYLWRNEAEQGQQEGLKHRPVVIVVLLQDASGNTRVVVAPSTHTPRPIHATRSPSPPARRIGLDDDPHWVVFTDLNAFVWPGPDLRPLPCQCIESAVIGTTPVKCTATLNERLQATLQSRRARSTTRSE